MWAAEGRSRAEWSRAAAIMAMVHNVNCTKKGQMKSPAEFSPFEQESRRVTHRTKDLSILRRLYVNG